MKTGFYQWVFGILIVLLAGCAQSSKTSLDKKTNLIFDRHVHIMSPGLIAYWKELGIPFSRSDDHYSNLDTILSNNGADKVNLIGMGYVYTNPEYYQGDDAYKKMQAENDYLLELAKKNSDRVIPYFAIDPMKTYASEEFDRCIKIQPNSGLKMHWNVSQVYLAEPTHVEKVKPVFRKAAENKLPILLHFDNWHPKFGRRDLNILLDTVLKDLPPVELTIAHFGGSGGFSSKTKSFLEAFIEFAQSKDAFDTHRILLDISAVSLDKDSEGVSKLTDIEFIELRTYIDKIGLDNIVFGSDYPLYSSNEYLDILKEKLQFTDEEIRRINEN